MTDIMLRSTGPTTKTINCHTNLVLVRRWSSTSEKSFRKQATFTNIRFALTIFVTHHLFSSLLLKMAFTTTSGNSGSDMVQAAEIIMSSPTPNTNQSSGNYNNIETTSKGGLSNKPRLLVDTKYWIKNTEFGLRDNWLNGLKPCTLLERIKLNEQIVISMGDSLDSLRGSLGESSNIRDLILALNGILLLEEDTFSDVSIDPMFIEFLNQSGPCLDSSSIHNDNQQAIDYNQNMADMLFQFQPDSDDLSWFNPNNWISDLNQIEIDDWIPESHSIPCSEDLIVFGNKQSSSSSMDESTNERSETLSFKVNFRASQYLKDINENNIRVNNLRVSRLKIGNQFYNQQEFNQLIQSQQYENILFEFNNSLNVLKSEYNYFDGDNNLFQKNPLLIIDESSYQIDSSGVPVCLDEAGCLCGNEDENIMKAICSFNLPLGLDDQPCYDPISSTGYCNRICATILIVTMEPTVFSEPLINSLVNDNIAILEDYNLDQVFVGSRRTYDNKYEITFRLIPYYNVDKDNYEYNFGKDQQLAEIIHNKLNSPATKSFYGIKSIFKKSSIDWKVGNKDKIFWLSFLSLLPMAVVVFIYQEVIFNERTYINDSNCSEHPIRRAIAWLLNCVVLIRNINTNNNNCNIDDMTESFVRYNEANNDIVTDESDNVGLKEIRKDSLKDIALIKLDSDSLCEFPHEDLTNENNNLDKNFLEQ